MFGIIFIDNCEADYILYMYKFEERYVEFDIYNYILYYIYYVNLKCVKLNHAMWKEMIKKHTLADVNETNIPQCGFTYYEKSINSETELIYE